jgi:hypothetical protein
MGAAALTFNLIATSTSSGNPRSRSSRPDSQSRSMLDRCGRALRYACRATSASAEHGNPSSSSMAPAPIRSSIAGRSPPSGQRSPAGITAMERPAATSMAAVATARAFLKQPVRTGAERAAPEMVEPFGLGRTSFSAGCDRDKRRRRQTEPMIRTAARAGGFRTKQPCCFYCGSRITILKGVDACPARHRNVNARREREDVDDDHRAHISVGLPGTLWSPLADCQ